MKQTLLKLFVLIFGFSQSAWAKDLQDLEPTEDLSKQIKDLKIKSLSDLQKLTPFESISVIQKRYLPKTFRGEFNLSLTTVINNTFFYLGGLELRSGFFITEHHGFGAEGFILYNSIDKLVTKEMIGAPNNILPYTAVFSRFYAGVYYKWSPIFGKFAILNNKIVYFDMYITLGAGVSRVESGLTPDKQKILKNKTELPALARDFFPSLSSSLGQVFALSKDWALSWELKWFYTYIQYEGIPQAHTPIGINFSLGFNYYFPGASYR